MIAPLFVLFASLAFATSGPFARLARPAHPLVAAFGRVLVAGILLLLLDPKATFESIGKLPAKARWSLIFGGLLLAAHFAFFLGGLDATSLPSAVALVSLEPLAVVVASFAMHGDRPTRGEAVGVVLAMIGGLLVARGAGTGEHRLFGDLLVIVAVALYGTYVGVVRGTRDLLPARHGATAIYLVAALVLALTLALFPSRADRVIWPLPLHSAVWIVALALVPTLVGHTAVQTAARSLSPSTVALVSPGETFFGIVISALFLGARPTREELTGAAVILAGATIAILAPRRSAETT
ncbi:MAG: DMT family transporter [Polyangiales bacterium]